jgi:hypothetical protein
MEESDKQIKEKRRSDAVAATKTSHGRIETTERVREAKSKGELDLELKRLKILNEIDKSTTAEEISLPCELKGYQQLIIIIGNFNLKSTSEILLVCKKLGYKGKLSRISIKRTIKGAKPKVFFKYDKINGWGLTERGQKEFSRLRQIL